MQVGVSKMTHADSIKKDFLSTSRNPCHLTPKLQGTFQAFSSVPNLSWLPHLLVCEEEGWKISKLLSPSQGRYWPLPAGSPSSSFHREQKLTSPLSSGSQSLALSQGHGVLGCVPWPLAFHPPHSFLSTATPTAFQEHPVLRWGPLSQQVESLNPLCHQLGP